jgi:hypothetical protein
MAVMNAIYSQPLRTLQRTDNCSTRAQWPNQGRETLPTARFRVMFGILLSSADGRQPA